MKNFTKTTLLGSATLAMLALSTPAKAVDVDFTGTVLNTCLLTVNTPGLLGLAPSGQELGSEQIGGAPAALAIVSTGANTVSFKDDTGSNAGHLQASPAAYSGDPTISIKYAGASGLSGVSQDYTTSPSSFAVGAIPLSVLTINAKAEDSGGFNEGLYTVRTVVTCAP